MVRGAPGAGDVVRGASVLAGAALVVLTGCLLYLAGGPVTTNDLWWHLERGERYAAEGPVLASDPCLSTAERPPEPHQWLFGIAVHAVERAAGLPGLRVLHAAAVAAIAALAFSLLRRAAAGPAEACLAGAVFVVLAWYRLVQLRPELASIAATLVLARLLIEPEEAPSWRRVGAASLLIALWANLHTLFMLGPLLLMVAAFGAGVRALLARSARDGGGAPRREARSQGRRAARLFAAVALGLVAALANPRGIEQHLAYLRSSHEGAIWTVLDEWAPFDPFSRSNLAPAVTGLSWLVADALLVSFLAAALWGGWRLLRRRSLAALAAADPVRFALGFACLAALLISVRFQWLAVFPLLALLHLARSLAPGITWPRAAAAATGCAALAAAFPAWGGFRDLARLYPGGVRGYFAHGYTEQRFFPEGVRFLEETGLTGNLFNSYAMGGFLCHRLAPRLRTFVDGSMNYPLEVQREYSLVNRQRGAWPHETYLDVLDRRGIDVFFGTGVPAGGLGTEEDGLYTAALLERAPGWLLVSRSYRHGIYLRRSARNRENLARVVDYYARQGVPFDPHRGFDVEAVIRERPDWAAAHGILPRGIARLSQQRQGRDPEERYRALETLGTMCALTGAYRTAIALDREAAALRPDAPGPLRRLVYSLLRLDRADEAVTVAERLSALDPTDARSRVFLDVARRYLQRSRQGPAGLLEESPDVPPDALVNRLPLVASRSDLLD